MPKDNSKVTYTTSIDRNLRDTFKIYCAKKGKYQNEVLEELISNLLSEENEEGVGERDGDTNK